MKKNSRFFIIAALLWSCNAISTQPAGPEEVLRQYQAFIDKNDFQKAKRLSTLEEGKRLDDLMAMMESQLPDSTIFTTTFLQINCTENADTSRCLCLVEDEFERYEAEYKLVKVAGKWLVDLPEEEAIIESGEVEEILESLDF